MTSNIILSIDASSTCTGYSIFKYNPKTSKYSHSLTDSIKAKDKNIYKRFETIHNHFVDQKLYVLPNKVIFENYAFAGNRVTQLAELNGLLKYNFALKDIPIETIAPPTIKKQITGNGRAKKEEVRKVIKELPKFKNIEFKNLDESDAFAVGLAYILKDIEVNK